VKFLLRSHSKSKSLQRHEPGLPNELMTNFAPSFREKFVNGCGRVGHRAIEVIEASED
jgi:hypothetical protein